MQAPDLFPESTDFSLDGSASLREHPTPCRGGAGSEVLLTNRFTVTNLSVCGAGRSDSILHGLSDE